MVKQILKSLSHFSQYLFAFIGILAKDRFNAIIDVLKFVARIQNNHNIEKIIHIIYVVPIFIILSFHRHCHLSLLLIYTRAHSGDGGLYFHKLGKNILDVTYFEQEIFVVTSENILKYSIKFLAASRSTPLEAPITLAFIFLFLVLPSKSSSTSC